MKGAFPLKKYRIMALCFAALTGLFVFLFLSSVRQSESGKTVGVVVAAKQVGKMTLLSSDMLEIRQIPADAVHPDAARSIRSVAGKITEGGLEQGEQILLGKLLTSGSQSGGLAYQIPEGLRAFTVSVDSYSGVGGYLKPGDRVDVIAELDLAKPQSVDKVPTVFMLLQNKEILATGSAGAGGSKASYDSVTLAVSAEESLRLELAMTSGKVRFTLRPPLDKGVYPYQHITADSLG